jgi:diacylglycerol kinase family enzyme
MSADRSQDSSPSAPLHIPSKTSASTATTAVPDLSAYTGVVVVGGDGMLSEVMQVLVLLLL